MEPEVGQQVCQVLDHQEGPCAPKSLEFEVLGRFLNELTLYICQILSSRNSTDMQGNQLYEYLSLQIFLSKYL